MSPAFLQLSDFLNPKNPADNPLANNQSLGTAALSQSISNLNQNLDQVPRATNTDAVSPIVEE